MSTSDEKDTVGLGLLSLTYSYEQGLNLTKKVAEYLKQHEAILVDGPGDLSTSFLERRENGRWSYHLRDSTLCAMIHGFNWPAKSSEKKELMKITFCTAGKNSSEIIKDFREILCGYKEHIVALQK